MNQHAGMGHAGGGSGGPGHNAGIEAHVVIKLNGGVDIWQAHAGILAAMPGNMHGGQFTLNHLHVALGEIDLLADVACTWTNPQGWETRVIGDWVNEIRKIQVGGRLAVASTSTSVCMNH